MADAFQWLQANWMLVGGTASAVVAGASLAVKAIAPLTETDKDDKVSVWLDKVHSLLSKLALNPPKDK